MTAGACILAPAGPALSPSEFAFFRDADPWGFIVFARNVETPAQLRTLTAELRESVGRHAPILIDQEGGRVQRLRAPHWREWLPPLDQVTMYDSERVMYLRGRMLGAELLQSGIDVNCIPSADIAHPETHPFLRNRCYGEDAETVTRMANATAQGLMDAGCLPVLKHAPGHGRATVDSHEAVPVIDAPLDDLIDTDFAPFRALAHLPMVMTAHILLPEVDAESPVTQSRAGVTFLRQQLGLNNLLMTDDISMEALSGTVGNRAARARSAGCDLVLHCNGDMFEMENVVAFSGALDAQGAARVQRVERARRKPTDIDISADEAELDALIEGAAHA